MDLTHRELGRGSLHEGQLTTWGQDVQLALHTLLLLLQMHDLLLVFLVHMHLEECQFNIRWMGTGWLGRWGHSRQELGSTWDLSPSFFLQQFFFP